jgi:uncharacterized membrane protein
MAALFKAGRCTGRIIAAVDRAGEFLQNNFPHPAGDKQELPDDTATD